MAHCVLRSAQGVVCASGAWSREHSPAHTRHQNPGDVEMVLLIAPAQQIRKVSTAEAIWVYLALCSFES